MFPSIIDAESESFLTQQSNVLMHQPAMVMKRPNDGSVKRKQIKPSFKQPLRDVSVEIGYHAQFAAIVTGHPTPLITWEHCGAIIKQDERYRYLMEGNKHMLLLPNAKYADDGVITCTATNSSGKSTSTARLSVKKSLRGDARRSHDALFDLSSSNVAVAESMERSRISEAMHTVYVDNDLDATSYEATQSEMQWSATDESNATTMALYECESSETMEFISNLTSSSIPAFSSNTTTGSEPSHSLKTLKSPRRSKKVRINGTRQEDKRETLHSDVLDESFATDWTDQVRALIREEIDKREQLQEKKHEPSLQEAPKTYFPPRFVKTISDCEVCVGETAHFVYILQAEPVAETLWLRNGKPIPMKKNAVGDNVNSATDGNIGIISDAGAGCLVISESEPHHSGIYTCVASNEHGSTKCAATLLVTGHLPHDDTISNHEDTVIEQHLIDRESQTHESRIDPDEDRKISDAFKHLENAERMRTVADVVIDDSNIKESTTEPPTKRSEKAKRRKLRKQNENDYSRFGDYETGEDEKLQPPKFDEELKVCKVCPGETVKLSCVVSGSSPIDTTWKKNGKNIETTTRYKVNTSESTPCLEIPNASFSDAGEYSITLVNQSGSVASSTTVIVEGR